MPHFSGSIALPIGHRHSLITHTNLIFLNMQVLVGDTDAGKGIFLSAILGRKKIDPSTFSLHLPPVAPQ